jgi:LysR family hydrogen peroxide-inducible transcriptional activator
MTRWSPHPFTLRQLQYALAVAEQRSFRRAAELCAVAQPSLSLQVAQLESALGVILFERLPRTVMVTEAGAALLERARRILVAADDLVGAAEGARDPLAGTLRIGLIPTVAPYLLPSLAPLLRGRFPRLTFLWREDKTRVLVERIGAGELEAAVVAAESDLGELAAAPLARDPFVLALPAGHPLGKARGPASPRELDGQTVLLLDDGHCFRDQALAVCARVGAEEASMRATSLSTLAQMVAGGAGITLLPALAVDTENRARGLFTRPFGARGPARNLVLVWRKTAPCAPALEALVAPLREVLAALLHR